MVDYSYRRNERGIVVRSPDGALIPENDPENVAFKLLQEWQAKGNELPLPPPDAVTNYPWHPPPPPGVSPPLPDVVPIPDADKLS